MGKWQVLLNLLKSNVPACNMTPARYELSGPGREEEMLLSHRQNAVGQRVRTNGDVQTDWNTEYNVAVKEYIRPVFLNRRAAARYRALASIILGSESFSWKLSF